MIWKQGMADLVPQEKLQPSMLDRLTDDLPETQKESRERRVLSLKKLREGVLRDIAWLLNTVNLSAVQDLEAYPEVEKSVINFGLPDLSGHTASSLEALELELLIKETIINYEPRINKNSLKVHVLIDESNMDHNSLTFDIEGELWAQPTPVHLYMKTDVDLESGNVLVRDSGAQGRS
jgi:type VI secretion system protein ImpF